MIKPKVLFISPLYPYPEYRDGSSKIVANLVVPNKYYSADILCTVTAEDAVQVDRNLSNAQILAVPFWKKMPVWYSVLCMLLSQKTPYNIARIKRNFAPVLQKILEHVDEYHIIAFVSHFYFPLVTMLPEQYKKKIIFMPLDSLSLFTKRRCQNEAKILNRVFHWFDMLKRVRFERYYFNLEYPTVFVSSVDDDYTKSFTSLSNSRVIPIGVDISKFNYHCRPCPATQPILLFTGNYNYLPNEEAARFLVFGLAPCLATIGCPAKICLVGVNSKKWMNEIVSSQVSIFGEVANMVEILHSASIFLSPIITGTGIKIKVLEAMSTGLSVIGTSVSFEGIGGEHEKHFIVEEGLDPKRWALAIRGILDDSTKREQIGANARALIVEKFSWKSKIKSYADLFNQVVAQS